MSRTVLYMAHPLGGDVDGNIKRALSWLAWLRRSFPLKTFVAQWIADVMSVGGEGTEAEREAGLVDDCAIVARLDGIVLVGGRISSGMARELGVARNGGLQVHDLTHLGDEPPGMGIPAPALPDSHSFDVGETLDADPFPCPVASNECGRNGIATEPAVLDADSGASGIGDL